MKYLSPAVELSIALELHYLQGRARRQSSFCHSRIESAVEALISSSAVGLCHRWAGILAVALQREVAHNIANGFGADLGRMQLEPAVMLADLPTV